MPAVAAEIAVPLPFKTPVMDVETVMAGVVVAVATVPAKPLVDTTLTLVTVPLVAGAVLAQVVPLLVSTLPLVLGATKVGADAPLPRMTLLAVSVFRLVPPLATASVPASVIVPEEAIGPPLVVNPVVPPETSTLVTVPVPAADQVPSPRQNVDADADVPLFRLVTGRLPVTPVVKGRPVVLVKVPLDGVPSAPPGTI